MAHSSKVIFFGLEGRHRVEVIFGYERLVIKGGFLRSFMMVDLRNVVKAHDLVLNLIAEIIAFVYFYGLCIFDVI